MFELQVENLAKIKKATIKLSDFLVFVGENNNNKTWLAYLIHAISFEFNIKEFTKYYYYELKSRIGQNFIKKVSKKVDSLKSKKNFVLLEDLPILKKLFKLYIDFVAVNFSSFLGVSEEELSTLKLKFYWKIKDFEKLFLEKLNKNFLDLLKIPSNEFDSNRERILYMILLALVRAIFGNTFYLPVERTTFVNFYNFINIGEQVFYYALKKKSSKEELSSSSLDFFLKRYFTNIKIPIPIEFFKYFMIILPSFREKKEDFNKKLLSYMEQLIDGKISRKEENAGFYYKQNLNGEIIDLPVITSSSFVKSLAGLYIYLSYKASKGDLLIIDEPENNLHPIVQVKMIEFLSILVNNGIKLIITTHSPYMVDHLVNLIEGYNSFKKNSDVINKFYLKNEEALIDKSKVNVYYFGNEGEVKNIFDKKNVDIDWETFSSVSESITNLYYEL